MGSSLGTTKKGSASSLELGKYIKRESGERKKVKNVVETPSKGKSAADANGKQILPTIRPEMAFRRNTAGLLKRIHK